MPVHFTRREYRCRAGLHRPGRGGSTPPSRRVRVANFDSEAPALTRMEHGANPWRPTISPIWLSNDSSSFVNYRARSPHESASLSIGSISASLVKLVSSSASNGEFAGESPAGCTNLCRVSPTAETPHSERGGYDCESFTRHQFAHVAQRRGSALKTRTVSVQIRPWARPPV